MIKTSNPPSGASAPSSEEVRLHIGGNMVSVPSLEALVLALEGGKERAWWSSLLAEAERDVLLADAAYRAARATAKLASLKRDSKVAEWKATAAFEAAPEFVHAKERVGGALHARTFLRAVLRVDEVRVSIDSDAVPL